MEENISENNVSLPESTLKIDLSGRTVYLVGTAHVSKESVEDVRTVIDLVSPDTVCVELCENRFQAYKNPDRWKTTDIFKVIKEGKSFLLLAQLILSSFYRQIGDKLDVKPGAEMFEAVNMAEERNLKLHMADRDVQVTLRRVWGFLSLWQKCKLLASVLVSDEADIEKDMVEDLKKSDQLEKALETFAHDMPELKKRLIDERDVFLAREIRRTEGETVVAVVGAGHMKGIEKEIFNLDNENLDLTSVPPPSNLIKIMKWLIPVSIIAIFAYGFFKDGSAKSAENIYLWVLANGLLSSLGVILALGHPLTVLVAFVAAPITSLNPMIAAGWVTGLFQAWLKKPKVADFEKLQDDITSLKGFWSNSVSRILLVVVLSNLGSSIGTFLAGYLIANNIFGS